MSWLDVTNLAGSMAGILGLVVSLYVLSVAKDARDAAEAARAVARRRNLMEELGDAANKLQQVGSFLQQEEWIGVQIRTSEVMSICRTAVTRWPDSLSEPRRNDLLTSVELVHSIATRAAELSEEELKPAEKKRFTSTHLRAAGLLDGALGEARRNEERSEGH